MLIVGCMVVGLGEVIEGGSWFCREVLLVIVVGLASEFCNGHGVLP